MNGCSRVRRHKSVCAQPRHGTQTYTVTENAGILPTFVPQEDQVANYRQHYARTNHGSTSVSSVCFSVPGSAEPPREIPSRRRAQITFLCEAERGGRPSPQPQSLHRHVQNRPRLGIARRDGAADRLAAPKVQVDASELRQPRGSPPEKCL